MLSHLDGPAGACLMFRLSTFSSQSTSVGSVYAAPLCTACLKLLSTCGAKGGSPRPGVCRANGARRPVPATLSPPAARTRSSSHLSPGGETPRSSADWAPLSPCGPPLWLQGAGARRSHFPHLSSRSPTLKGEKQTLAFLPEWRDQISVLVVRPTARASGASLRGILVLSLGERGS